MEKLVLPTIHRNGTSRGDLIEQWTKVHQAANALRKALGNAAPNARDYYMQGPGEYDRARAAHAERLSAVEAVAAEALQMAIDIQKS